MPLRHEVAPKWLAELRAKKKSTKKYMAERRNPKPNAPITSTLTVRKEQTNVDQEGVRSSGEDNPEA